MRTLTEMPRVMTSQFQEYFRRHHFSVLSGAGILILVLIWMRMWFLSWIHDSHVLWSVCGMPPVDVRQSFIHSPLRELLSGNVFAKAAKHIRQCTEGHEPSAGETALRALGASARWSAGRSREGVRISSPFHALLVYPDDNHGNSTLLVDAMLGAVAADVLFGVRTLDVRVQSGVAERVAEFFELCPYGLVLLRGLEALSPADTYTLHALLEEELSRHPYATVLMTLAVPVQVAARTRPRQHAYVDANGREGLKAYLRARWSSDVLPASSHAWALMSRLVGGHVLYVQDNASRTSAECLLRTARRPAASLPADDPWVRLMLRGLAAVVTVAISHTVFLMIADRTITAQESNLPRRQAGSFEYDSAIKSALSTSATQRPSVPASSTRDQLKPRRSRVPVPSRAPAPSPLRHSIVAGDVLAEQSTLRNDGFRKPIPPTKHLTRQNLDPDKVPQAPFLATVDPNQPVLEFTVELSEVTSIRDLFMLSAVLAIDPTTGERVPFSWNYNSPYQAKEISAADNMDLGYVPVHELDGPEKILQVFSGPDLAPGESRLVSSKLWQYNIRGGDFVQVQSPLQGTWFGFF